MQALIDEVVPELVGTAYSPMDLEMITFPKSNTTEANNELAQSVQNIFANAGASQLVISGGSSTNSVGLKHAIQNDISTCWGLVNKMLLLLVVQLLIILQVLWETLMKLIAN